jgi:ferritin-like protein
VTQVIRGMLQQLRDHRLIGYYKKLLEATQGKAPVTYNIVQQIFQDEVAHEEDLQSLLEDLEFFL